MTVIIDLSAERAARRPATAAETITLYRDANGRLDSGFISGPPITPEATKALALDLIDLGRWMLEHAADEAGDVHEEPAFVAVCFRSSRMRMQINTDITDKDWCVRQFMRGLDGVLPAKDETECPTSST